MTDFELSDLLLIEDTPSDEPVRGAELVTETTTSEVMPLRTYPEGTAWEVLALVIRAEP